MKQLDLWVAFATAALSAADPETVPAAQVKHAAAVADFMLTDAMRRFPEEEPLTFEELDELTSGPQ
jgi:hypothetical protein